MSDNMPYIDYQYYKDEYRGIPIEEDAFNRLVERATDIVDEMTQYRLKTSIQMDSLPPFIQGQLKKATAAQVEYMNSQGEGVEHGEADVSSVSIGKFNYSEGQNPRRLTRQQIRTSPAVTGYLASTGLLYRGVKVLG